MICTNDFVQLTDQQRFKHSVVNATEKFEKIIDEITKIRSAVYEEILKEDIESKQWSLDTDINSIETAIEIVESEKSEVFIQYLFQLKSQLNKFEQLEKKQTLIKKNVPQQQRKFGMNLHLYNQMLKKRKLLIKYFNYQEDLEKQIYC